VSDHLTERAGKTAASEIISEYIFDVVGWEGIIGATSQILDVVVLEVIIVDTASEDKESTGVLETLVTGTR
jgi:hypothetical protein